MSWINSLMEVYDYIITNRKKQDNIKIVPIGNMTQNAQVEITIDSEGNFLRSSSVEKEKAPTIIPCTIKSANRTAGSAPHPLYDNISYLAGDLFKYMKDEKKAEKQYSEFFEAYFNRLKKWVDYEKNNEYLNPIYNYLSKKELVKDLVNSKILNLDEKGFLIDEKIEGISSYKIFIRIAIEENGELKKPWEDFEFQEIYSKYYLNELEKDEENIGFCYALGEKRYISDTHGKYIRYPGDGAKILSSNDTINFTFKGRFINSNQSAQISYEASEKAHSALRFLIRRQGYINDGYTVVSWSSKNIDSPNIFKDTEEIIRENESIFNILSENNISEETLDLGDIYAKNLRFALNGYKSNFSKDEKIHIIALDNATPGRLAILYYKTINAKEFVDRLEDWYESISWIHHYKKDRANSKINKNYIFIGAASPIDIIKYSFGIQRENYMDIDNKIQNKLMRDLIPSIIEGRRISKAFVYSAFRKACGFNMKSYYNWDKTLTIACGLIKRYLKEREGKDVKIKIDEKETDRSYLYGRLLAIAEKIELNYLMKKEIERPTKALVMMDSLSKKPARTWVNLRLAIKPYIESLSNKDRLYFQNLISDVTSKFKESDFENNRQLGPKFILGYDLQRGELRYKKEGEKKENE